jgi:hypothetical protein
MQGKEHLVVDIKQSRQLVLVLVLVHVLAVAAVKTISIPPWLAIIMILFIALSLIYYLNRIDEVSCLVMQAEGNWLVKMSDGTTIEASLDGNTYVGTRLVLLNFRTRIDSAPIRVCLLGDSVSASMFSLLKLKLKVIGQQADITI